MLDLWEFVLQYWPHFFALVSLIVGLATAAHAAMNKSDVRAAIGWVGVILFSPIFGPILYAVAGINRIRHDQMAVQRSRHIKDYMQHARPVFENVRAVSAPQFESLRILADQISPLPLHDGNHITLLDSGDCAYPAMLSAIDAAKHTIGLQSYIFDHDQAGLQFVQALARAHERGVQICVLIDAVGARYSRPPIARLLRSHGIRTELFMTNPLGLRSAYANLRSHRKILVVDGHTGFMGGMNIRASFLSMPGQRQAQQDTHFRIQGPLVTQLFTVFANDWEFTTRERLELEKWCLRQTQTQTTSTTPAAHNIAARCVRSGPDRFIAATHQVLMGAIAVARERILIQSPYFLPDQILISALNTAARRGIRVDILIPGRNNLRLVNYAMTAQLEPMIQSGCRIWRSRGAFDHSKLLTIDNAWAYVGSSNLDPRSLRLNFELDMEIYDRAMACEISARIDAQISEAELISCAELRAAPYIKRLRNRIIWLASPYL